MPGEAAGEQDSSACRLGDGTGNDVPDLAARVAELNLDVGSDVGGQNQSAVGGGTRRAADYDWALYHSVWKDTPIDEAITAMFAEYAVLHAELSGYVCSTAPLPLTLQVGKCIADRAKRFVTLYVTPILGPQHSTKVHKLLRHVMDAIRMHGNINNGNSGVNERMHKEAKPYYARTNKDTSDFTRQLVIQAHGAHIIQQRISADNQTAAADVDSPAREDDFDEDMASDQEDAEVLNDADSAAGRVQPTVSDGPAAAVNVGIRSRAYHLRAVPLSSVSQRPGLAGIAAALGLPEDAHVRLSSRTKINATFDCGLNRLQLLYASPSFRGEPWYDCVLYQSTEDPACASVGEVRAIVRRPEGDAVVLAPMDAVPGEPRCPLVARGCTRLAWSALDDQADVCLKAVPLSSIRRVLHVVPDFGDLAKRGGLDAEPARLDDPVEDRLAMRFFINAFYPWGP